MFKLKIVLVLAVSMILTGNVFAWPIKILPGGFDDSLNGRVNVDGELIFVLPVNNSGIPNALERVVDYPGFELVLGNQIWGNHLVMYYLATAESYGSWSTYEGSTSVMHGIGGGMQTASIISFPVPEPAAILLLGAGLLGLARFCRNA